MNVEEIRKYIRAVPFKPFRVYVSDGSSYDVPHHDFILLTKTRVEICKPADDEGVPEHTVLCDPIHVTRIEEIRETKRRNGSKHRP